MKRKAASFSTCSPLVPQLLSFISRKLAIRFVGDDPPQALVDRMAKVLPRPAAATSPRSSKRSSTRPSSGSADAYRAKVKTPLEFVVSAARATQSAPPHNMQPLVNALRDMGMPLYGAVPPTGYNWQASTWVSTGALVNRMNFALSLAANKLPGITVNWTTPADLPLPSTQPLSHAPHHPSTSAKPCRNRTKLHATPRPSPKSSVSNRNSLPAASATTPGRSARSVQSTGAVAINRPPNNAPQETLQRDRQRDRLMHDDRANACAIPSPSKSERSKASREHP